MFSTDDCEGGPYFAETCEGHSDRAAYKYPLHIIRLPTVNALLCVLYVHMISSTTSDASLMNHFILAPGVCPNLTICGSVLNHNFGRVWLLTLS